MGSTVAKGSSKTKRAALIAIALLIIVGFHFFPLPEGLSYAGKMSIALILAGIILWITEPVPLAISGLGLMISMPLFGVLDYTNVWVNFISSVVFFIICSFAITAALLKTKIPVKMIYYLLNWSGTSGPKIVLGFLLASTALSAFISNLPCAAMFAGIAMSILKEDQSVLGESRFGKTVMIAIPFGTALGGCITPAGSALNVLCINVLRGETGINIPFLHWVAICAPIIIITLPIAYFFLIKIFKPEDIKESTLNTIREQMGKVGPLEALDQKVVMIILITIAAWILSTWTHWDLTAIAVACTVAFFLPGIDAITWKEFTDAIAWPVVFLIGSVQSIAGGMVKSGAAAWIISGSLAKIALGSGALIAGAAFMLPLIRLVIPVGPPVIFISLIPLAGMAKAAGISAVVFTIIIAFAASVNLLLAIDANALITYSRRWYTMGEYFVAGIAPTLTFILCHIFLLPILVRLVGL